MLNRRLSDFGIKPVLGYALAAFAFIGLSLLLFQKTEYAAYIYPVIALFPLVKLSEVNRNDFLRSCFPLKDYRKMRLVENFFLVLPFVCFLTANGYWIEPLACLIASTLLSIFRTGRQFNFHLPTPFFKFPFEYTVGFRKTWWVFIIAYFLAYMSITVGNFNLGIFALVISGVISISYHSNPEAPYYVWIFAYRPAEFLWYKLRMALVFSTLLSLPVAVAISIAFPHNIIVVLVFQFLCSIYLVTLILGKYSTYPQQMGLPQAILIGVTVWFPPLLLGIIPAFYSQSKRKLEQFLS